jgi:hypothetical protein
VGRALKSLFLIKKTWFLKILFIKNQ